MAYRVDRYCGAWLGWCTHYWRGVEGVLQGWQVLACLVKGGGDLQGSQQVLWCLARTVDPLWTSTASLPFP